jgi:hypothetical protein
MYPRKRLPLFRARPELTRAFLSSEQTAAEIGQILEWDPAHMSRVARGVVFFSVRVRDRIVKLAAFLGVDPQIAFSPYPDSGYGLMTPPERDALDREEA